MFGAEVHGIGDAFDAPLRSSWGNGLAGRLLDLLRGELVAPPAVPTENRGAYPVVLLEIVVDITDEGIGHFGDVNKAGIAAL